jgi:hypothetical protein
MTKSENVWESKGDMDKVWDYIKENPRLIGLPLSERRGIDLLSALKDIYETNKINTDAAQVLLTLLANVLVAASQGDGEEVIEEVLVQDAMLQFESKMKEILNEGHQ